MAAKLKPFEHWWLYLDQWGGLRFSCVMGTPEDHRERAVRWVETLEHMTGVRWRMDLRRDQGRDSFSWQYKATRKPALHTYTTVGTVAEARVALLHIRAAHPARTVFWIKNFNRWPTYTTDYSIVSLAEDCPPQQAGAAEKDR